MLKKEKSNKIKAIDYDKVFKLISDYFDERKEENIKSHQEEFQGEIQMLERFKVQFFLYQDVITERNEHKDFKGRCFFAKRYLNVVANNFQVAQTLFEQGFHIQLQLIFRSQFEFINTLIAFLGDDDFFLKYGKECSDSRKVITPKRSNTEKSIRKIMKEYDPQNFNRFWKEYKHITEAIYSELSMNAHGNILSVSLQSMEGIKNEKWKYNITTCGVNYPLARTKMIVMQMLYYFQLMNSFLFIFLERKNLMDKRSEFYDFLEYYSKNFEVIKQ
ncbi:MAG: hypothetical protein JJE55_02615 [Flavobacteriaceae bacterium]|nr:hypothetical protein [Flavobacteriaceae bacterium]